jgi:hypothetical protein
MGWLVSREWNGCRCRNEWAQREDAGRAIATASSVGERQQPISCRRLAIGRSPRGRSCMGARARSSRSPGPVTRSGRGVGLRRRDGGRGVELGDRGGGAAGRRGGGAAGRRGGGNPRRTRLMSTNPASASARTFHARRGLGSRPARGASSTKSTPAKHSRRALFQRSRTQVKSLGCRDHVQQCRNLAKRVA